MDDFIPLIQLIWDEYAKNCLSSHLAPLFLGTISSALTMLPANGFYKGPFKGTEEAGTIISQRVPLNRAFCVGRGIVHDPSGPCSYDHKAN